MIKTILARARGLAGEYFYINFSMQLSFSGSPFSHLKNRGKSISTSFKYESISPERNNETRTQTVCYVAQYTEGTRYRNHSYFEELQESAEWTIHYILGLSEQIVFTKLETQNPDKGYNLGTRLRPVGVIPRCLKGVLCFLRTVCKGSRGQEKTKKDEISVGKNKMLPAIPV